MEPGATGEREGRLDDRATGLGDLVLCLLQVITVEDNQCGSVRGRRHLVGSIEPAVESLITEGNVVWAIVLELPVEDIGEE